MFLFDDNGVKVEDQDALHDLIIEFYKSLLATTDLDCRTATIPPGRTVDSEQFEQLLALPSKEDVKRIVWSIGTKKSPGPDGFGSDFFRRGWRTVGNDMYKAVKEFFTTGRLLKQTNHTFISLVPKVDNPSFVKDLRPISCCNTSLKVITKILTEKVKMVLEDLISDVQGAFVPGRSLAHNVAVATEILKGYGTKNISPRCAFKVDLYKAYDTLNWSFIRAALEAFSFPSRMVDLIMECVSSPTYSVIINGVPQGFFQGKRGLRQGDPLSPYLFVICMEVLSRKLLEMTKNAEFRFHPKCKSLGLVQLAFADDLLIFCKGHLPSVMLIKKCLEEFSAESGLRANEEKSQCFLAGVSQNMKELIVHHMGYSPSELPVRYLGCPLNSRRVVIAEYAPLIGKIEKLLNSWSAKCLSYAGRMQLIKSVITGILGFWDQLFVLPAGVMHRIESMCKSFLWSGKAGGSKFLVAWSTVTLPYSEGGLGIKEVLAWNKAIYLKLAAEILLNKQSIWLRWVECNHTRGASLLDIQSKDGDSWLWKSLLRVLADFQVSYYEQSGGGVPLDWNQFLKDDINLDCTAVYEVLRQKGGAKDWGSLLWHGLQSRKWSFVTWLAIQDKLYTGSRLYKWGVIDNAKCFLCGADEEHIDHIFFECPFSCSVMNIVLNIMCVGFRASNLQEWLQWFVTSPGKRSLIFQSKLLVMNALVYHIWYARNRAIHEKQFYTVDECAKRIVAACKERIKWKGKAKKHGDRVWKQALKL